MKGAGIGIMMVLLGVGWMASAQSGAPTAGSPAGLDELKKQFESSFRDIQRQGRDAAQAIQKKYVDCLSTLEESQQAAGNMTAVLTVREEKTRALQAGTPPEADHPADLPILQQVQNTVRAQNAAQQRDQAQKIVTLSERYLQNLATLQKTLAAKNDAGGVEDVKAEKERLLGNSVVRDALALLHPPKAPGAAESAAVPPPTKPPDRGTAQPPPPAAVVELGGYTFYPAGKEPPKKSLQTLRLDFPASDRRAAQFLYELRVSISTDKSSMNIHRSAGLDYSSRTEEGSVTTTPRVTLGCKNREIPEGCSLFIEYYSRPTAHSTDLRKERVERIRLPPFGRGQALTVDGRGISLEKYYYRSTYSYRSASGREFYGLIISVFDSGDKLLFQQCVPSALNAMCATTLPHREESRDTSE